MSISPDHDAYRKDINAALLLSMGYDEEIVYKALRITGNNYQRANEWLVDNYHNPNHLDCDQQGSPVGVEDDAMEIQDELERIESDDEQSDVGFPIRSFEKVKRILDERKFVFYRAGKSLDICIMAALSHTLNDKSESICDEFMEEVLPDCITAHVNPNESFKYGMDHIERSYQFCCAVIPLFTARLRRLPISRIISLSICQLLNVRNRLLQIVRRKEVSESHLALLRSKEWVAYCDPNRLITENSHPNGVLQEMINIFINRGGFGNISYMLHDKMNEISIQDAIHLLTIPETIARFIDPSTVNIFSSDWVSSIVKMLETLDEKQIRDGECRQQVLNLLSSCQNPLFDIEDQNLLDSAKLSFLLRCIRCSQLDSKMFSLYQMGLLAESLSSLQPLINENMFNKWIKDNGILHTVLGGNMDQPAYVMKMRPIITHMTPELTSSDLGYIWSLRKGRMGVSADAFSSILAHIATSLNEQQLEWLQHLFIKCFRANETKMYDRIFMLCKDIGKSSVSEEIGVKMVNTMWELIILARPCNYSVLTAVTLLVELINDIRNSLLKEEYIQTVVDDINTSQEFCISNVVFLRELLEGGAASKFIPWSSAVTAPRKSLMNTFEDFDEEKKKLDDVIVLFRDSRLYEVLCDKLLSCQRTAHAKISVVIDHAKTDPDCLIDEEVDMDIHNPMLVEVSDHCNYAFVMDNVFQMLRWLIENEVHELTWETIDPLWNANVINDLASNSEKAMFFNWLRSMKVLNPSPEVVSEVLDNFCEIDPNRLPLDGFSCMYHFFEQLSSTLVSGTKKCLDRCIEYLWQLLEFTEDSEVVKEVTKKLIKRGTDYDLDGSRHRRFLATCYGQMDVMRREYFKRLGLQPTPGPLIRMKQPDKIIPVRDVIYENVVEPSISGTDWLSYDNEPLNTTGPSQMSLNALIQGIVRLLQLIATYIEAGDEHYKVARNFPSHGSLVPGRSLRVYYNIENELRDAAVSPPFIRTNSQETIGQFRSRIANRLHFRGVRSFTMYMTLDGKLCAIPTEHEWKTLEQVGLVSPGEGVFIFEDIRILIRVNRSGMGLRLLTSSRGVPEKQLPSIMIQESRGVFDVLHQLSCVADQAIRDACRLVLNLIPTDPAIACHLRPKIQVDTLEKGDEDSCPLYVVDRDAVRKLLDTSDPYRLLYTLEAMAGFLIPMNASEKTISMANRIMNALVHAYLFDHIRAIIAQPYVIPSITPSDRTKIFELCITILRMLLVGQSVLWQAVNNDDRHLKELESKHSTVDQRRVDSYYTDLSQLVIQRSYVIVDFSADEFMELVTSLRDFIWLMTAGWLKHTTRMLIYKNYSGQENSTLFYHSKSAEENNVWEKLCDVAEAESASAAIRSVRIGALTERDTALVGGALALLMKCVYDRMKSLNSQTNSEEKIQLLAKICHNKLWKSFWTDVLVNSVSPQIRQRAYEAIVNFGRSQKAESSCVVLSMLFSMTDALPYSGGKTCDLDDLGKRQRLQCYDIVSAISFLISMEQDIIEGAVWTKLERDPQKMAMEIANVIMSLETDSESYHIDMDFILARIYLLKALLLYCTTEVRTHLGRTLIEPILSRKIFTQRTIYDDSKLYDGGHWSDATRSMALELLADLTAECPENALILTEFLRSRHNNENLTEWDYKPAVESRVFDHVGLRNAGATCYMNSVLQQLFAIPGLAPQFLAVDNLDPLQEWDGCKGALVIELQRVFAKLMFSQGKQCTPSGLWKVFQFSRGEPLDIRMQHDAIDFFSELVDKCDTVMQKLHYPLLFKPHLGGKFIYEYICNGCWHRYVGADEEFLTVNLELHGSSLEESLEHYVDGELLDGENAYMCEKCNQKRTTLRRGSFNELPDTLSFQLKRFSYDYSGGLGMKSNNYCSFPFSLDMTPFCREARIVHDGDLESLFEEVYSNQQNAPQVFISRNINGNHGASPRTACSPLSSPTSPNKWNNKRRRRVSSVPIQLQRQDATYELVGVLAHSGNQAAGHYISFVKERRDEMVSSASYGEWIEMNDTLVDQFYLTQMNMDKYWFGGKSETSECSPRLEMSQNRWRTFNAYVLFYQKTNRRNQIQSQNLGKESNSLFLSHHQQIFQSMPEWLRAEITQDCAHFFKSRDLYSLQHAKMLSDVVRNFIEVIETVWEGETADSERDEMAEKIFEVYFSYCTGILWRLSSDIRAQTIETSVKNMGAILKFSPLSRRTFFRLIKNNNYELFDIMCTSDSPDDAWSAWWRLVSHAICSYIDDMESITKKEQDNAQSNIPIEILRRMMSIISPGGRIRAPLRCLRQFIDVTSSSTMYLFSAGCLTVLYDLIVNEWTQSITRLRWTPARLYIYDLLYLYLVLLKKGIEETSEIEKLPQIFDPCGVLILNWLYSVHHMDTQLCDSIEDIFCMADQKWPEGEYMKSVVQFILEKMLCEAIAIETWTFTAQLVVNVCGKLLQLGCPNAMQGLEELLDAREEDAAENQTLQRGLIPTVEEWLVSGDLTKASTVLSIFSTWEKSNDESIYNVLHDNGRTERIAAACHKLDELRQQRELNSVLTTDSSFLHMPSVLKFADVSSMPPESSCITDRVEEVDENVNDEEGSLPSLSPTATEGDLDEGITEDETCD